VLIDLAERWEERSRERAGRAGEWPQVRDLFPAGSELVRKQSA